MNIFREKSQAVEAPSEHAAIDAQAIQHRLLKKYKKEIEGLQSTVRAYEQEVTSLQSTTQKYKNKATTLQSTVRANEQEVTSLQNNLQKYKKEATTLQANVQTYKQVCHRLDSELRVNRVKLEKLQQTHELAQNTIHEIRKTLQAKENTVAAFQQKIREYTQQQRTAEADFARRLQQKSAECQAQLDRMRTHCKQQLDNQRKQAHASQQDFNRKLGEIVSAAQAKYGQLQSQLARKLAQTARTRRMFEVSGYSIVTLFADTVKIRAKPDQQALLLRMKHRIFELQKKLSQTVAPGNQPDLNLQSRVLEVARVVRASLPKE